MNIFLFYTLLFLQLSKHFRFWRKTLINDSINKLLVQFTYIEYLLKGITHYYVVIISTKKGHQPLHPTCHFTKEAISSYFTNVYFNYSVKIQLFTWALKMICNRYLKLQFITVYLFQDPRFDSAMGLLGNNN